MINLTPQTKHPSKLLPGVTIVIRNLSVGLRIKLRNATSVSVRKLVEANDEIGRLSKEFNASIADLPKEEQDAVRWPAELSAAFESAAQAQEEVDQEYVRIGLEAIEGAEIDHRPITADDVIERLKPEFFQEVVEAIKSEYGLTEREKGESAPPSTSGEAEGGSGKNSTAENASAGDTTAYETVTATSPKT